jgi:hypothetical protein
MHEEVSPVLASTPTPEPGPSSTDPATSILAKPKKSTNASSLLIDSYDPTKISWQYVVT